MIYIMNQGGGAKELAIKVLGGITQPTGKAGYIWVNTATAIGKYTFSVAEPGSPASGDVWLQMDAASTSVVELLRTDNSVKVNILRVKQYNGTNWDVCAAYYHDGTSWTQVSFAFDLAMDITYTGSYTMVDDGSGDWLVKFLTSGTLTFTQYPGGIDVFAVGGGAGGNGYGAGGAGYTTTSLDVVVDVDAGIPVSIGAGSSAVSGTATASQGGTTALGGINALGGYGATSYSGGDGGSGGGGEDGGTHFDGGVDGADGEPYSRGGIGQHTTTREFAEASGTLYSTGGSSITTVAGTANTGDGGGRNAKGGSGIVIIRNHRAA